MVRAHGEWSPRSQATRHRTLGGWWKTLVAFSLALPFILPLILFVLGTSFFIPMRACAQPRVTATAKPDQVEVGQRVTIEVTVSDAERTSSPSLVSAPTQGQFTISQVGSAMSTAIGPQGATSQQIFIYALTPSEVGTLTVPRFQVTVDGNKLQTEPLTITVLPAGSRPRPSMPSQHGPSQPTTNGFSFSQTVAKRSAFIGEQIVATLSITSPNQLLNVRIDDQMGDGIIEKHFGRDSVKRVFGTARGRTAEPTTWSFRAARALFPIRVGSILIPPREATIQALTDPFGGGAFGGNPFGNFGLSMNFPDAFTLKSNGEAISVQELPEAPRDLPGWRDVAPLVGVTEIVANLKQRHSIRTGEEGIIESTIVSFGNLPSIGDSALKVPPSVSLFPEPPQDAVLEVEGKLMYRRRQTFRVIPSLPGKFELGPLQLGYFDPIQKSYQIASSEKLPLEVTGDPLVGTDSEALKEAEAMTSPQAEENSPDQEQLPSPSSTPPASNQALLYGIAGVSILGGAGLIGLLLIRRRKAEQSKELAVRKIVEEIGAQTDPTARAQAFRRFVGSALGLETELPSPDAVRAALLKAPFTPKESYVVLSALEPAASTATIAAAVRVIQRASNRPYAANPNE